MDRRAHIIVKGKVQGVFFRDSAKKKAEEIGVTGTIQNMPEGNLEIIVEGTQEKVKEFIAWCHKGPPLARVSTVAVVWYMSKKAFKDFKILT